MIIAIDGPAASGKGTLGKRLAHHYGYRHLDTGVIYRAVAKALMDAGADLTNETLAVSAALELDPEKFGNPALKTQIVGDAASVVSAFPKLREVLLNFQRQFAADPPGAVLDGRDIGTVICPHADVKIFVVADPKVRARRRTLEARARGEDADEAAVLADILNPNGRRHPHLENKWLRLLLLIILPATILPPCSTSPLPAATCRKAPSSRARWLRLKRTWPSSTSA